MSGKIESLSRKEAELRAAFWEQVGSFPEGFKIKRCLQCGTCTGTCPVSYAMDLTPRQVVAMFRAGHIEEILQSRTIWLCASCYACTVRCPADIRVTDTMYALKRIAMAKKIYPGRFPVHTLSHAFINNVFHYGRNYELGLGVRYFARTGIKRLISNAGLGWSMIRRGRMGLVPKKLKRVNDIQAIIKKANEFGEG
jgi:heterodisulfide reductase subunit C